MIFAKKKCNVFGKEIITGLWHLFVTASLNDFQIAMYMQVFFHVHFILQPVSVISS